MITKINVDVVGQDSIGTQIFDRYYAYKQSLCSDFSTSIQISFSNPSDDAINIAFSYMPESQYCDLSEYDFVFADNAGESLEVSTPYIAKMLEVPNFYFVCGAFLKKSHRLSSKVIPFNHNIQAFRDYITRGFYPQYYSSAANYLPASKCLTFINGQNRSWRQFFLDNLTESGLDITVRSSLGNSVVETPDCFFESDEDTMFRIFLNNKYPQGDVLDYKYYDNSIKVGIDSKFGRIDPGYFLINDYYQYHCVVFPETSWINDQYFATEKIYKCFVSGAIPFPIGGANIHTQYNNSGYQTAWNLLPKELQIFDSEPAHQKRYEQIINALQWLNSNQEVFCGIDASEIRQNNKLNFYRDAVDLTTVTTLDRILRTSSKYND